MPTESQCRIKLQPLMFAITTKQTSDDDIQSITGCCRCLASFTTPYAGEKFVRAVIAAQCTNIFSSSYCGCMLPCPQQHGVVHHFNRLPVHIHVFGVIEQDWQPTVLIHDWSAQNCGDRRNPLLLCYIMYRSYASLEFGSNIMCKAKIVSVTSDFQVKTHGTVASQRCDRSRVMCLLTWPC